MNRSALPTALVSLALVAAAAGPAQAAEDAELYAVHGLPGVTVDVLLDGEVVGDDLEVTDVAGPFSVDADGADLTVEDSGSGEVLLEHALDLDPGSVTDVVVHRPADPEGEPVATSFDLDLAAQPADKGELLVAHTAAVGPADIRVDGEVLFSNVANGESLSVVVPSDTYEVDIVPTGKDEPLVFGPVDLPVEGGAFQAVYAVGDPAADSMTVAVHTVGVEETGSEAPERVETGTTGSALVQSLVVRAFGMLAHLR